MKKKPIAESVVSPEIMEMARRAVASERPSVKSQCKVCGADCTPLTGSQSSDDLCWVCRRLKISAWRDSDQQLSAQE